MNGYQMTGALLVSVSLAFLYFFKLFHRHRLSSQEIFESGVEDLVGLRLSTQVRQAQSVRRRAYAAVILATLVGGVLLLIIPERETFYLEKNGAIPQRSKVATEGYYVTTATDATGTPVGSQESQSEGIQNPTVSVVWAAVAMGGLAVLVGAAVLVFGPRTWVRLVGAGTLGMGLIGNGYLIKEMKFSELVKFDTHIDKVALELDFQQKLKQLSEFGPEHLAAIENFESGKAELRPEMLEPIKKICQRWEDQGGRKQKGILLVTGATDRVPLAASIRRQYESNMGLARARAEQVRARVLECGVPAAQIVTLASGPRNTPPAVQDNQTPAGFAEDRSVVVWALWNVPVKKK